MYYYSVALFISLSFLVHVFAWPATSVSLHDNFFQVAATNRDGTEPEPHKESKYDLWRSGVTLLRGTNIWQRRSRLAHTETACLPPGHSPEQKEVIEPYYEDDNIERLAKVWKANYLNLSIPGLFYEDKREIKETVRGRDGRPKTVKSRKYLRDPLMLKELERWLSLAAKHQLFVVVAFRTGPGRTNEAFDNGRRKPSLVFDEGKGGEFREAQDGWKEMWAAAADILKNHPNVVGYDLMVEPDTKKHPELWMNLAGSLIKSVRAVDQDTPILVEAPDDALPSDLQGLDYRALDPHNELKLVYCVHQYEPTGYMQQNEDYDSYDCKSGNPEGHDAPPYGSEERYEEQKRELDKAFGDIKRWRDEAQEYYRRA